MFASEIAGVDAICKDSSNDDPPAIGQPFPFWNIVSAKDGSATISEAEEAERSTVPVAVKVSNTKGCSITRGCTKRSFKMSDDTENTTSTSPAF